VFSSHFLGIVHAFLFVFVCGSGLARNTEGGLPVSMIHPAPLLGHWHSLAILRERADDLVVQMDHAINQQTSKAGTNRIRRRRRRRWRRRRACLLKVGHDPWS
jgi:hypothetical protein